MDITSFILGLQKGKSAAAPTGNFTFKDGSFFGTGAPQTVEHNIGKVPDIFVVTISGVPDHANPMSCICFSSKMLAALGGGYLNKATFCNASGGIAGTSSNQGIEIDQGDAMYATYGGVHAFTSNTFKIGGETVNIPTTTKMKWYAILDVV